jgi:hypothetical protein
LRQTRLLVGRQVDAQLEPRYRHIDAERGELYHHVQQGSRGCARHETRPQADAVDWDAVAIERSDEVTQRPHLRPVRLDAVVVGMELRVRVGGTVKGVEE